jgi:hypothetical protein
MFRSYMDHNKVQQIYFTNMRQIQKMSYTLTTAISGASQAAEHYYPETDIVMNMRIKSAKTLVSSCVLYNIYTQCYVSSDGNETESVAGNRGNDIKREFKQICT